MSSKKKTAITVVAVLVGVSAMMHFNLDIFDILTKMFKIFWGWKASRYLLVFAAGVCASWLGSKAKAVLAKNQNRLRDILADDGDEPDDD